MDRKYKFRYFIATVLIGVVILVVGACTRGVKEQTTAAVETPPPVAEAAPAPTATPAAEPAPTPAPEPAPVAAPTPAPVAPTSSANVPDQFKDIDPSLLIYLSSRGVVAGTGDPTKVAGDAEKIGQTQHPAAMELGKLPKDKYGLVDWATAIKNGNVKPLDSLEPGAYPAPPFNLDIVVHTKSNFMNEVVFPH